MKAAVVEVFGKPLVLREWNTPTPGAGQILVKTEACGVCHTDLHAARGDWAVTPTPPFIPGHEGIGLVAAIGFGVKDVKEGDRVGVPWLYSACGHCEYCLSAWEAVRGSLVGTRQDMAEALAFAAEGKNNVDIERPPLSAINQVLDRFERGAVAARVVLDFAAH